MEDDKQTYIIPDQPVPSFARAPIYAFADQPTPDVYHELAAISEEITKCRSKILGN